ncbi:transglutaminase family protein [Nitrincola tapanii]|uniref:Transglutaminase family protein n=1 Tax=Nitrincola tapanii TaxID=1708751 RepID=A0A5A9W287_9GAMM|nr:transglutaminase family protein [Nitrincola tapanii]KAA0874614.1 transglutaminase family protein [Nitrincola tapanii]
MTIRVALKHSTRYDFDKPVSLSPHLVRLRPAPHCRTPIDAYSLKISGGEYFINWQQDPFGNHIARLVFPEKVEHLQVEVELLAPMTVINPFDFFVEDYAKDFPFTYEEALQKELTPYLEIRESGPLLTQWLSEVPDEPQAIVNFLVALNQRLEKDIDYTIRMEPGVQSAEETLEKHRGSCRDSAWLMVQALRHLGLAARFVSGYLIQLTADVKALDGPSGTEVDFTDLHAWTEVFIPGAGWIGLDPTSGLFAGEGHIPLAATPEPSSAAPISGCTDPCEVEFDFHMEVNRVHEDPRVTKPYTDEQWQRICALGEEVDAAIEAEDLRLTMGGEPTFVSIDDMDAPEWTIAAHGPNKRRLSEVLMRRLRPHFAPGSLIHYQQGKWYPGESLPRWALACYWRKDGQPIWRNDLLLADMNQTYAVSPEVAHQFATALTRRLQVSADRLIPCFEDAYYYLWLERQQPVDIDLSKEDLKDEENRRRLAQLLERGLDEITGYALPLSRDLYRERWLSGEWPLRREHLYLIPGDSPMGFRLPLSALPLAGREEMHYPSSLFEPRPPLSDLHGEVASRYTDLQQIAMTRDGHHQAPHGQHWQEQSLDRPQGIIHTALCVEPREGKLFIFMPPLARLEDYLELLACIELTAAEMELPVCIEGYAPPSDPRIEKFMITPDPGVIEVNIMPARSWRELVNNTTRLYEEARLSRLGTEKFMLDGRHTGTGGGNHVTLGGETPADSPFLRRPDLLASMITYWQHHPSLSYLFIGMFMGPTSQAPRIDEARHEALYELEIALQQMPVGEVPQPWMVDRLLRHLLTDITGNTHRAEFCIDKLYSPDSATGRLGLVELRGFEMPPHAQMSLMQQLLIRALVARFAANPYRKPLVRWGTALHDRWLMPHYLWEDLKDVLHDLGDHGFYFNPEWFAPFLEFRFPHYGDVIYDQVRIELRQAIEPWHVLGEEVSGSGTARYVDSSVERLQVKVFGFNPARHQLTCNGRRVPLQATGVNSEAVAAIRYRAWQPPSALHPMIPVHAPLVFDLVDTWNGRSLGGCTYHVSHPAGRNYESFPVNANEAEARRLARFWAQGHTQGPIRTSPDYINPEYPHTLDLRRQDPFSKTDV